jgi:hypothetical protein
MATEMVAQNPHLHAIGANWRKGANTAAKTVAKSPAGEEFREACGIELDSLRKRLVRAWTEHGRRLLQEHVMAAQDTAWVAYVKAWQELEDAHGQFFRIEHGRGQVLSTVNRKQMR